MDGDYSVSGAEQSKSSNWDGFAAALSDLTKAYRIGIEGAVAYETQGDDHLFGYTITTDGAVIRC